MFRILAGLKRLRATIFDPFGHTLIRRAEVRIRDEYENILNVICLHPNAYGREKALRIASVPEMIRGNEAIKMARVAQYESQLTGLQVGVR